MRKLLSVALTLTVLTALTACGPDPGPASWSVPASPVPATALPVDTPPAGDAATPATASGLTGEPKRGHPDGFTARTPFGRMYPDFDPSVKHYAVKCRPGGLIDFRSHAAAALDAEEPVEIEPRHFRVDGQPVGQTGSFETVLWDDDHRIQVSKTPDGPAHGEYILHCLPLDMPDLTAWSSSDATDQLVAVSMRVGKRYVGHDEFTPFGYIALVDRNGVPRFQRYMLNGASIFRPLSKRPPRYGWPVPVGQTDDPYNRGPRARTNFAIEVADEDLRVVERLTTVDRLHTDNHDFAMTPDGNYLLMAYEPALRDMSSIPGYSEREPSHDSLVQVITPDGELLLEWSSWGQVALEDCTQHWFPPDYSHINSVQWVDGNVLVSLRGCARVLLFDGRTGETVWSVGPTTLTQEEHRARGMEPPLRIEGDPESFFCGQHSAELIEGNRLILYDNAVLCPEVPHSKTGSRVVEYEVDPDRGRIVWRRDHHPLDDADVVTYATGNVVVMENGNWIIGWGAVKHDGFDLEQECPQYDHVVPGVVEYDPRRDLELMRLYINYNGCPVGLPTRAWPVPLDQFGKAVR